jgi:hypothetical protein
MNTLTINSKAALTLARATEKAKQVKPRVRKTATYGGYEVEASDKSTWYTVTCNSATKEITCNCKARKPCYHISSVTPIHVFIARQLRDQAALALRDAETEVANWPVPVEVSEVPNFDGNEEVAPVAAPADFAAQVEEVRAICADTTAQLAAYTAEQEAQDRADLFG